MNHQRRGSGNPHWGRWAVLLTVLFGMMAQGQEPPDPNYVRTPLFASYADFRAELLRVANLADPIQRTAEVTAFWQQLRTAGQVPYAQDNQVAFLYRGGGSVSWPGDANGWNPNAGGWRGQAVGQSDIQMVERVLPSDARVDYKLVVNGNWILDPANPLQMWGGFGPNSELRMPDYQYPLETIQQMGIDHGTLSGNQRITSGRLGQDVQFRVYTPAGFDPQGPPLPTVYFTDGHEYAADYLGSAVQVIDNLIAAGQLRPLVAVFVDPRHPDTGVNQRAEQYVSNRDFAAFLADELVSHIDGRYATSTAAADRTILGTSLGGLNSAYVGAVENDVFQNLGIQSPAFWVDESVTAAYRNQALVDRVRIFMTNGTIRDSSGAGPFADLLAAEGYDFRYTTANESHSWGNWRAQLDDMLIDLVGAPVPEPSGGAMAPGDCLARDCCCGHACTVIGWPKEPVRAPMEGASFVVDLQVGRGIAGGGAPLAAACHAGFAEQPLHRRLQLPCQACCLLAAATLGRHGNRISRSES